MTETTTAEMPQPQAPDAPPRAAPKRRPIRLGSGGPLSFEKAGALVARSKSRLIVLAGPTESGKTTLIASIFDAFHAGPFAGFLFGGSSTLMALEERCHEGRMTSGLDVAKTARTSSAQAGDLVHFVVSPESTRSLCDVLINDVTGELFDAIVRRPSAASNMPVLSRADRIAVALDGALLLDVNRRDIAVYQAETLARAIAEYGDLRQESVVDVLVTKLDVLKQGMVDLTWVKRAAEGVARAVDSTKRGKVLLTCARSQSPKLVRSGRGVGELLQLWVAQRPEPRLGAAGQVRRPRRVVQQ